MRIEDEDGATLNMVRFRLWRGEAASLVYDAKEAVETLLEEVDEERLRSQSGYTVTLEIRADGSLGASAEHRRNPSA